MFLRVGQAFQPDAGRFPLWEAALPADRSGRIGAGRGTEPPPTEDRSDRTESGWKT
jgi:hypothetical protein